MPVNLNNFKSSRWRVRRIAIPKFFVPLLCAAIASHPSAAIGNARSTNQDSADIGQREVNSTDLPPSLKSIDLDELLDRNRFDGRLMLPTDATLDPMPTVTDGDGCPSISRPIEELWRVPIDYRHLSPSGRHMELGALARANYLHDQRYEFTGTESSFGVESQLFGTFCEPVASGLFRLTGELYLTQPFDRNLLVDYPERESFQHNFDVETLEISQLSLDWNRGDWTVTCGRFVTPFGRYHLPLFSNNRSDSAFIRSEAILFRETGLQLAWAPNIARMAVAMTNGSDGRDTNSSKAVVARCGVDLEHFVGGVSVKWQDGIGSEGQKQFNNHAGFDWLVRNGRWAVAGEFIYDQYGMRRPGLNLDDIAWGRSLYNRQLNNGLNRPIAGLGYYGSVIYREDWRIWTLTYGQFFPDPIGDPIHDSPTQRLMGQLHWSWSERVSNFTSAFWENEVPAAQAGRTRHGFYLLTGLQYTF